MKIAVIGGGISGLSAAYWLSRRHRVTLFEANDYLGGHSHTVDVTVGGESHAIDTGFIVFNNRTYPNFVQLLHELGVSSRPTSMSFSVQCERSGLEYSGSSFNTLFSQRSNLLQPKFYRMLLDIVRFNRDAARHANRIDVPSIDSLTVADYLQSEGYSRQFVDHYLMPMGAAIWSCPVGAFGQFPFRFMVEFFQNHGLLSLRDRPIWRVIEGGSRSYVQAIVARFDGTILLNSPIQSVRRMPGSVEIRPRGSAPQEFDHVVFACHSDQALRMLADPTPIERTILTAFPYERNTAILHTDSSLLPRAKRA